MYKYIYIYLHVYIYTYIHIYMCMHIYIFRYIHVHIWVQVRGGMCSYMPCRINYITWTPPSTNLCKILMNTSYHTHAWVMSYTWIHHWNSCDVIGLECITWGGKGILPPLSVKIHTHEHVTSHICMYYSAHMQLCFEFFCYVTWLECITYTHPSTTLCKDKHIWIRHVTYMNKHCHTHEWVWCVSRVVWFDVITSHGRVLPPLSVKIHMNMSCHTYARVMSRTCMCIFKKKSHVTLLDYFT